MSHRTKEKLWHRRKFLRGVMAAAGLSLSAGTLVACGNDPTATATANPTTKAILAATPGAPLPPAPTPTISSPTIPSPTIAANPITATPPADVSAAPGTAPAGYTQVGKVGSPNTPPLKFSAGKVSGFIFMKSATQPVVFSNICTHQGCGVAYSNAEKKIICPCHGSEYNNTGQVIKGPASLALEQYDSKIVGDTIFAKLPK